MNMETGRNLLQSIFFNLKYADPMLGIYGLHDAGFGVYTARPSLQHIHGVVVVLSHFQSLDIFEQFLKNPVPFDLFYLSVCSENSFSTMSQFQFGNFKNHRESQKIVKLVHSCQVEDKSTHTQKRCMFKGQIFTIFGAGSRQDNLMF